MHSCGTSSVTFEHLRPMCVLWRKNLNSALFDQRILKLLFFFVFFLFFVVVKVFNVLFLLRDWHGAHHSHCTSLVNVKLCVCTRVCVCVRTCEPYTKVKMHNRLNAVYTTCIRTPNKCSCICKWLYMCSFFFLLFVLSCCNFHRVFIHGIFLFFFFFFFPLLFDCFVVCCHLHFCCLSTLPSNTQSILYTQKSVAIVLGFVLSSGFARWLLM